MKYPAVLLHGPNVSVFEKNGWPSLHVLERLLMALGPYNVIYKGGTSDAKATIGNTEI